MSGRPSAVKRIRKNFGKIRKIVEIPDLIGMQRESFTRFLQMDVDLFDRMHRQHELRKRGINWWDLPVDGMSANLASPSLAEGSRRKF